MNKNILTIGTGLFLLFGATLLNAQNIKIKEGFTADVYTTSKSENKHIAHSKSASFAPLDQPFESDVCIFIDPTHKFEAFMGFGGAITDASAQTFAKLPKEKQDELLKAYYDKSSGLGYNIVRTHMNSCDFGTESYVYIKENDNSLKSFDVSHDDKYRIPLIKKAQQAIGDDFTFYFSPWSPPAWMKTSKSMLAGGHLLPEYYQVWADYYVKFIDEYEKRGIPVWGLTIQNESMAATPWEACQYTANEQRVFIKNFLGPTLGKANKGDKKIIVWDHNRDLVYQYVSTIMNDPDAAKYVWGAGVHWYETWTKSLPLYENVKLTKQAFPNLNLMFTEGCLEKFEYSRIYDVALGELYGSQILNDLNCGLIGWTDWNILLDQAGGPNHLNNFCFAPIHANVNTGELYYTYGYWYIGQFSKFIKRGAQRVIASSNRSQLETTSFVNPDGKLVVVVLNKTDKDFDYNLWIGGQSSKAKSTAHSISTWVL